MNSRGIFCFLILLAFASMQLNFFNESIAAREQLLKAKAIAIEAEQLHALRTAMEINADALVEQTMQAALLLGKCPAEIKEEVNRKLLQFTKVVEESHAGVVEINFARNSVLSLQQLNENSKVNVIRLDNHSITAEYTFTGGLLKDKEITAEIRGRKTKQFFKIPVGYTARATVVG